MHLDLYINASPDAKMKLSLLYRVMICKSAHNAHLAFSDVPDFCLFYAKAGCCIINLTNLQHSNFGSHGPYAF